MDWWPTSLWFNHEDGPFTDKDVRWAVSYSIDRQQMLDVALAGSGIITPLPFPQYPPCSPTSTLPQTLLAKYPTNEFNLDKAAELMEGQGYEKDGDGFWVKDGERIPAVITRLAGLQRHRPDHCRAVAQGWLRGRVHHAGRQRHHA